MREAVIVSTARTPIGKAYRGAFNNLRGRSLPPTPFAPPSRAPVLRAVRSRISRLARRLDPGLDRDQHRATYGHHLGASGQCRRSDDRPAMRLWAERHRRRRAQVTQDGVDIALAGGLDSISLVQNDQWNGYRYKIAAVPDAYYMSMLETAEVVAERYGVRGRRRTLRPRKPAAHRPRAAGRSVRRRDRAGGDGQAGHRQGYRCDESVEPYDRPRRRMQSPQHHVGGALGALTPVLGEGTIGHRRQCQPDVRRRVGAAWSWRPRSGAARARPTRHLSRHGRGGVCARGNGDRPGSSPSPGCCGGLA